MRVSCALAWESKNTLANMPAWIPVLILSCPIRNPIHGLLAVAIFGLRSVDNFNLRKILQPPNAMNRKRPDLPIRAAVRCHLDGDFVALFQKDRARKRDRIEDEAQKRFPALEFRPPDTLVKLRNLDIVIAAHPDSMARKRHRA